MEDSVLKSLDREELLKECLRRGKVLHNLWAAITKEFGTDGFLKMIDILESKRQKEKELGIDVDESPCLFSIDQIKKVCAKHRIEMSDVLIEELFKGSY